MANGQSACVVQDSNSALLLGAIIVGLLESGCVMFCCCCKRNDDTRPSTNAVEMQASPSTKVAYASPRQQSLSEPLAGASVGGKHATEPCQPSPTPGEPGSPGSTSPRRKRSISWAPKGYETPRATSSPVVKSKSIYKKTSSFGPDGPILLASGLADATGGREPPDLTLL